MHALRRPGRMLVRYLRPLWPWVLLLTALLLSSIAVQLINPQIIRYFIDTAQSGGAQERLFGAALLFLTFALARQLMNVATAYASERIAWEATNRLRSDLAAHVLRLEMAFHKEHTPGELIDRIDGDVTTLANFFSQLVIRIGGNLLLAFGILALLFREDWRFGLIGLAYALLLFLLLRGVHRPAVRMWAAARSASASLYGFLEERLLGTEEIRANGAVPHVLERLGRLMQDLLRQERKAAVMGSFTFVSGWALYVLSYIGALGLGAALFLNSTVTLGTVYLVVFYLGSLETPLNEIRYQITDLQRAVAGIGRVDQLLLLQPRIVDPVAVPRRLPEGALALRFDDVSFAYDDREMVLHDVSFHLEAGQVLGLLGRTGSGKTTITRLLFRLYDLSAGSISLDGSPIAELQLADLRQGVGMVTQEVELLAGTVRDNLTFFSRRWPDERLLAALEELGLSAWLESLPQRLDTALEAGGKGLSAGEAQLLAFARLLLRDPGLVILDEASSRLDPATERLIERAVDRLLQGRTGIIIAHRLGTVQRADEILILEAGRVVEYGPRVALGTDPRSRYSRLLQTGMEEVLA
jgi:ATP-binding cassette subfamily B protein